MREAVLRVCLTQIFNLITVFLFYLFDNPIRNVILSEGYPLLFCTICVYICAPLTLAYLICYWLLSGLVCVYRCAQNCCVILHDWCTGVRSCTGLWKVCSGVSEGEDLALRGGLVGDVRMRRYPLLLPITVLCLLISRGLILLVREDCGIKRQDSQL